MQRLDPKTNLPFKKGDVREDGYLFDYYHSTLKKNGFFREKWRSIAGMQRNKESRRLIDKRHYEKNKEKISVYQKEWYQNNKEKMNEFAKKWYQNNKEQVLEKAKHNNEKTKHDKEYRAERILKGARKRARQKNLEINIDKSFLNELLKTEKCALTGVPFDFTVWEGKNTNPFAPSVDRIDSEKGYIKDNVRIVLFCVNSALNSYGLEFMVPIFKKLITYAQKNTTPPVSIENYRESQEDTQLGSVLGTRIGQNGYRFDDNSGTVQGKDADHSAQESGGDSMGRRSKEVESSIVAQSIEATWPREPKVIWVSPRSGHLSD